MFTKDLWNEEVFHLLNDQELDLKVYNLRIGLKKIARLLYELNKKTPPTSECPCLSNPDMNYIRGLEQRQITWKFVGQAIKARDLSELQFTQLAKSAVVHGDLQLRNILVRGDQDMHLIDYAGSGPGHPAIDLVRLELALYCGCFKQLEEESRYELFQQRLSLDRADVTALESCFGSSRLPAVNKVCIGGCIAARDQALKAVEEHGGDYKDYLAAKCLVAWQNLLMEGRQTNLTRSIINALAPEIASW
jgi:tRNA A-37 threonylcarbamoyl transferase component Bud32